MALRKLPREGMAESPKPHCSRFRHLGHILFPNKDWDRCSMAMFTAYFDGSGKRHMHGRARIVAGFVSTVEKWATFEPVWLELLTDYGITPPFHMNKFAGGAEQYASWKDDKLRRQQFMAEVVRLIKKYTDCGFSEGMIISDFHRIHQEYVIPDVGADRIFHSPFTYCAMGATLQMFYWMQRRPTRGRRRVEGVEMVYDRGEEDWGQFVSFMRDRFGKAPFPRSAALAPPIQLADILAWESARHFHPRTAEVGHDRESFIALANHVGGTARWAFAAYEKLQAHCEERGFPKREIP